MTTTDILKQLEKAVTELVAENERLKQSLVLVHGALESARVKGPATDTAPSILTISKDVVTWRKTKTSKTPKAPRTTKAKRGRKFLFSDAQVLAIREQHNKGASVLALAKEHKVSPPTIYNALTRGLSTPIKASTNGAGAGKH